MRLLVTRPQPDAQRTAAALRDLGHHVLIAPLFEVEALFQPIAGHLPAGQDIREDTSPQSFYYRIKDARTQARARAI